MMKENNDLPQNTNTEFSAQNQSTSKNEFEYFEKCTFEQFRTGEVFERLREILEQDTTGAMETLVILRVAEIIKTTLNIKLTATQFKQAFNQYKKNANARDKEKGQNADRKTKFPDLKDEQQLTCKNYICNADGIVEIETGRRICENSLLPTATLVGIDENDIEKIEISFQDHRKRWRKQVLPCSAAYSKGGVIALANAGAAVTSKNAEGLAEYLCHMVHTNGKNLPEKKCISRAGWYIDPENSSPCFYPYSTGKTEVVNGASGNTRATLSAVHTNGSKDAWLDMIKPLRAQNKVLRAYLCASFASPLLYIVGGNPFFVHLYGESSTGKTVSLKLCASVWGNPEIGGTSEKYIQSLHSTENSIEFYASVLFSLPCCLDELQARASRDTDNMIYKLCQGIGRERMTKAGDLNNANLSWKNLFLTTGEQAINGATPEDNGTTSGGGAIGRVLNLRADEALIQKNGSDICNVCDHNYGHAGKTFIDEIINRMDKIRDQYKEIKTRISPDTKGTISKQYDGVALLILADELSSEIIFGDEASKDMEEYLLEMIRPTATANPHSFSLDWLQGLVTQNAARFSRHNDNEKEWDYNPNISYIGSITESEISINKQFFASEYNKHFKNSSCALFLKWAQDNKILYPGTDRKYKARKYTPVSDPAASYVFWKENILPQEVDEYTGVYALLHAGSNRKEEMEKIRTKAEVKTEAKEEAETEAENKDCFIWEETPYQSQIGSES